MTFEEKVAAALTLFAGGGAAVWNQIRKGGHDESVVTEVLDAVKGAVEDIRELREEVAELRRMSSENAASIANALGQLQRM